MAQARKLNFQTLVTNSKLGVNLAITLGRLLPSRLGYLLTHWIADRIASRKDWAMVRAARTNQWVVSGLQLSGSDLDGAVRKTFRNHTRALYDYYHFWHLSPDQQKLISFNAMIEKVIERSQASGSDQGAVVVAPHLSNFDFGLLNAFRKGLRGLVIRLQEMPGGYQQHYDLLRSSGMEVVTASMATFRLAVARLQAGGVVLTGLEFPIPEPKYRPLFFGYPASVPVHYIQLALMAHVPVILGAIELQEDQTYSFWFSEPIPMQSYPDRQTETIRNAEAVLSVAEGLIRKAPHQWAMFHPVWPELMDRAP